MPNSVKVGARPSICSIRWYSSVVSPCSATSAGVTVGSPGRGAGFTCLGMMKNLENVAHEPAERTARLVNVANEPDLALIEPNAVALRTDVDFHVLEIALLQITTALRALIEVLAALDFTALLVEQRPHFLDQPRVLACKILVFVAGWMVFSMAVHDPPGRTRCLFSLRAWRLLAAGIGTRRIWFCH